MTFACENDLWQCLQGPRFYNLKSADRNVGKSRSGGWAVALVGGRRTTPKRQRARARTLRRLELSTRLIRKWELQSQPVLKVSRDVTFASRIFDQRDVSGSYWDLLSSGNLHFS